MATFIALNVEPESDSEEELDDTQEIQIEEALKLYQNALKLHSQGPDSFEEAEAAYDALFNSEIFSYPESLTEARRLGLREEKVGDEDDSDDSDFTMPVAISHGGNDGATNSLTQLLYLSYKNHAQFLLDRITYEMSQSGGSLETSSPSSLQIRDPLPIAAESLGLFGEALGRDDTDLDLWRRTSKIGNLLGSHRIARFSLEAALASGAEDSPMGIERQFAEEELRDLLSLTYDQVSDSHDSIEHQQHLKIPDSLRRAMDPCPLLQLPYQRPDLMELPRCRRNVITVSSKTLVTTGKAILQQVVSELQGELDPGFGPSYVLKLPHEGRAANDGVPFSTKLGVSAPTAAVMVEQEEASSTASRQGKATEVADQRTQSPVVEEPIADSLLGIKDQASRPSEIQSTDLREFQDAGQNGNTEVPFGALPTRKRTSESAGMPDPDDGGRVRSKRIRARAELAPEEDNEMADLAKYYNDQLQPRSQADDRLAEASNRLISKIGLSIVNKPTKVCTGAVFDEEHPDSSIRTVLHDFKQLLLNWNIQTSNLFLHASDSENSTYLPEGDDSGLSLFLQHSKPATQRSFGSSSTLNEASSSAMSSKADNSWMSSKELALLWITELLRPRYPDNEPYSTLNSTDCTKSHYLRCLWSDDLKETVVQSLILNDDYIHSEMSSEIAALDNQCLRSSTNVQEDHYFGREENLVELIQTIFELHLDVYGRITNPRSKVDAITRILQNDRTKRWAALASEAMSKRPVPSSDNDRLDSLSLRYLWSSILYVSLEDKISRDHIVFCLRDLKRLLEAAGSPLLALPNNAGMQEISVDVAEREISKLMTMDFFLNLFDPRNQDPVDVIEKLEPLLINARLPEVNGSARAGNVSGVHDEFVEDSEDEGLSQETTTGQSSKTATASELDPKMQQMSEFLEKASVSLRLYLWKRLRTAYDDIDYPPMVFVCFVKSIEVVLQDLCSHGYINESTDARLSNLMMRLRTLNELVARALRLASSNRSAFECMDEQALRSAIEACVSLTQFLHVFTTLDDSIAVGQTHAPVQPTASANTAYKASMNSFREMNLRVWMLQYLIFKEAISQCSDGLISSIEELADYLVTTHRAFGIRHQCSLGKRAFLKFVKNELLSFGASDDWELDMGQIISDLYGLKVLSNSANLADHGCVSDSLDRTKALEIMDFVLAQAQRLSIKDLLKTDLKSAIDKMQSIIGAPKGSSLMFNRRIINAYLKSPLNPIVIYRSLRGIGALSGASVNNEFAVVARKGWYFLLGYIMLVKFRSQKRISPSPTEDLDIAITFFRIDLEFDLERWETWYRLAQVYDTKIDEDTTWNADRINGHKGDLITLQKNAIHCYTMAVAVAVRSADSSFATAEKISELCSDFGTRLYASSREPFSMAVFSIAEYKRFCNSNANGMYERPPFRPFHEQSVWTLASVLFKQALVDKPTSWMNWYMLGKCLWKIYSNSENTGTWTLCQAMLGAFTSAIEHVPGKRDSRHPDRDPILEPHYKLVSVVHKLVQRRKVMPEEGCHILRATPYSRKVSPIQELEDWEGYILQVLKSVRAADKANWHHRMVARAAHILTGDPTDFIAARAAKHELTQQIFTKTMAIQVWKPEHERAGRHFVYTARYVRFFVQLLIQVGDRPNLELLGKRVRKKPGDFADHANLWTEVYMAHLKLLRFQSGIPEAHEEAVFKSLSLDIFATNTAHLETWAHSLPPSSSQSPAESTLGILREAIELKKLNANLGRVGPIDDLIGDSFARLYELVVPDLLVKLNDEENRDRMRVNHLLMSTDAIPADRGLTPVPVPAQDQSLPRSRPKIVTRKEIGRRAENVAARFTAPLPSSKPKTTACAPTSSNAPENPPGQSIERYLEAKDDGPKEVASSVPGSVHDSADDESELSEIEEEEAEEEVGEEEEQKKEKAKLPMFPGLLKDDGDIDDEEETLDEQGDDTLEAHDGNGTATEEENVGTEAPEEL